MYELIYGNIFDRKCDLLIVPCNSMGGVTGTVEKELEENNIIYLPKAILAGKVKFADSLINCQIASVVGFAASTNVLTLGSNTKYIKSICMEIKKYCKEHFLHIVNIPLLGTGAGRLTPQDSFEILKLYFNDDKDVFIKIHVLSKDIYQSLLKNEVKHNKEDKRICKQDEKTFDYDIVLSFAGEDRQYVEEIANEFKKRNIRVFYDKFEVARLFGKDLYQYLSHIYKDSARFCMIFVSKYYKEKAWTKLELRNAQNRAFRENKEYILPVFLENVELDGLNDTIGHLKSSEYSISEIVDITIEKMNEI